MRVCCISPLTTHVSLSKTSSPIDFSIFFSRQRTIQKKNYVVFISQDKTNNKETSGRLKTGLLTVTDEKFGFVAQSAYVFAKNKSR